MAHNLLHAEQEAITSLGRGAAGLGGALQPINTPPTPVEDVSRAGTEIDPTGLQVGAPEAEEAALAQTPLVSESLGQVEAPKDIQAVTLDEAVKVEAAQGQAIQRDLEQGELMSEQLAELTAGLETGDIPDWAKPAVAAVERQLQARGLSSSSIGRDALFNSIIQSAMPMAQANAQALQRRSEVNLLNEQQMAVANLSNEQQSFVASAQLQHEALISNQAAENAAIQFNAVSEQTVQQFNAQMKSSVAQNNASRIAAMEQFNAGQMNSIKQFNAQLETQVAQFNVANATAIAESNTNWRRQANLTDTAAQNTANMQDAMNRFNADVQDMANRWQSTRDLAHWAFQSGENNLARSTQLALGAMSADAARDVAAQEAYGMITAYGLRDLAGEGGVTSAITGLLSSAGGVLGGVGGAAMDLAGSLLSGLGGSASNLAGGAGSILSGAGSSAMNTAGAIWDTVSGWFN